MSFILDALKKSETERQRQNAPGIASIPETGQRQSHAKWPWIVAGLLAVNLVVLAVIMLKPDMAASTTETAAERTEAPIQTPSSGSGRETIRTMPEPAAGPSTREVAAPARFPATTEAVVENSPPQPAAQPPTITDGLPSLRELQAAGQIQLPDMHLDIHVYSGQPDDRFVFVNMSKYKEGATLREGPKVTEITPDGVVLDYFGTRFLLPRE